MEIFLRGYRGKKETLAGVFKADSDPHEREWMCRVARGGARKIAVPAVSPIPLSLNHITSVHILLLTFKTLLPLCYLFYAPSHSAPS